MKIFKWHYCFLGLIGLVLSSCIEPYEPPLIQDETAHLVVDGYLVTGGGSTIIRLSRSQQLSESGDSPGETGASVSIEGERGSRFSLTERAGGEYILDSFQGDVNEKYRLRIRTKNGREYLSEYVPVKITPKIDNISWEALGDGVQIYVNTHDPANNTWYYRWDFEETWEFKVPYPARIEYKNGKASEYREDVTICWASTASKNIFVNSTTRLSEDVVHKYPIEFLPANSIKHGIKYSILVRQYALTKEAYDYWLNLRKNTENIGTLFDPLPSQISSNIHCVNAPEERVFGFFSAHSVAEQRIFIARNQLPDWRISSDYDLCKPDTVMINTLPTNDPRPLLFVAEVYPEMGPPIPYAYTQAAPKCMDCRTAGTNRKPSYWQ